MSEHVARHLLEELLAGEARASELRAHVDACEHCTQRLHAMERARAAFLRARPADALVRNVSAAARATPAPHRRAYRWAAVGGIAALVAAALLALRAPQIRYRGTDVSLQAYVREATGARPLHDGDVLSGGAQLSFTYTLRQPGHLLLLGIDDAGTVTRYFPDGRIAQSSALAVGVERQLPVGIELDARPGRERLIALFSAARLDETSARAQLTAAWRRARGQGKDNSQPIELALPAQQISFWIDKP